jgi:hypothetical protein
MKLYLWWWWNPNWGITALQDIHTIISNILAIEGTKQLLHIPFARTWIMNESRKYFLPQFFSWYVESLNVEYLNTSYIEDIQKFKGDTIYINWGNDGEALMNLCMHPILKAALNKARVIVGESYGAMICAEYLHNNDSSWFISWLWFIKNTLVLPHYNTLTQNDIDTALNIQASTMLSNIVAIDEYTFIPYQDEKFWEVVGTGTVHFSL